MNILITGGEEELTKIISPEILDAGEESGVDIDFGDYMIKIQCDAGGTWHVTNAMNGWGHNCFELFVNAKVRLFRQ